MISNEYETIIIGAGMAGITCARELHRLGKSAVIIEKSRGVGGRMATRRLFETIADHGSRYLSLEDMGFELEIDSAWLKLCRELISAKVIRSWTNTVHSLDPEGHLAQDRDLHPSYIAPDGMSSIAKYLAANLDIRFNQKVIKLVPLNEGWQITMEGEPEVQIFAKKIISTMPAPQIMNLLAPVEQSLPKAIIEQLRSTEFDANIAVIAGYSHAQIAEWAQHYPGVCAVTCLSDPLLDWLGVDSSKRDGAAPPVFVLQSTADFAKRHLNPTDSHLAATALLNQAGDRFLSWLARPQWQQTQVWRYAFARNPLKVPYLQIEHPAPLILTGDWCGGRKVENAVLAGAAVAKLFA